MSWSVTQQVPQRATGPGWSDSPTSAPAETGGGWFALLEKVAPLSGNGGLSANLLPRIPVHVNFSGGGVLLSTLVIRKTRDAALSSVGSLTAGAFEIVTRTVGFSGSGQLGIEVNDGLSASIRMGSRATFSGAGVLGATVSGPPPLGDGLSATAFEAHESDSAGVGTLGATVVQKYNVSANFGD